MFKRSFRRTCGEEHFKTQCFNGDWTDDLSEVCRWLKFIQVNKYLNPNSFSVSIWFIVGLASVAGFSLLTLVATVILLSRHRTSRRRKGPDPAVFLDQLPPGRRQEEEEPSRSTRSSEVEEVPRAQERRGWTEQREFPRYPVSRHLYQVVIFIQIKLGRECFIWSPSMRAWLIIHPFAGWEKAKGRRTTKTWSRSFTGRHEHLIENQLSCFSCLQIQLQVVHSFQGICGLVLFKTFTYT